MKNLVLSLMFWQFLIGEKKKKKNKRNYKKNLALFDRGKSFRSRSLFNSYFKKES